MSNIQLERSRVSWTEFATCRASDDTGEPVVLAAARFADCTAQENILVGQD